MTDLEERPTIDLYVRSLHPNGAQRSQEEIIERLRALDERGRIAELSIHVWGKQVPCEGNTAVGRSIHKRIKEFEGWSDRVGTSLSSFFETRDVSTLDTDESQAAIVLPTLCLAESHGDTLQYVSPCVDNGTVCTIRDRLDALEENYDGNKEPRVHA